MKISRLLATALVAASATLPLAGTASAAPLLANNGLSSHQASNVIDVRWRGGHRHHGWRGHGGRGHGWRHGYHRGPGWGPAIGGLAAGAIIGGAIASSNARASSDDEYCSNRFKSYDPSSGTYLGYDGNRHACP